MTHSPRQAILAAVTAAAVVALTGCTNPFPGIQFTPEETITSTGMENAPYPADLEHLDDILALGKTTLPEGTTDITVSPALKTAEASPRAWGYVIAYHADPQPIRNHIETYTNYPSEGIDHYPDSDSYIYIKDIDFTDIQHPLILGFGKTQLVIERPPRSVLAPHPRRTPLNPIRCSSLSSNSPNRTGP